MNFFVAVKREQDSVLHEKRSVPVHVLAHNAEGLLPRARVHQVRHQPL